MVRVTHFLYRVPVIKFRKGGGGSEHAASAASSALKPGSCPVGAPGQAQPASAMSTGAAIPDIDLPARYRRQPLSEEEIAHINGGGVV